MNLRRWARWGMALLLVVTGLLLGVYLLRDLLIYPHLKTAAVAACRSELDLLLDVGAIRGPLLSGLEMDDVQVRTMEPAETPLDATIAGIRLTYRLGDLLQGIESFLGGMTIELRRPRLRIDLTRPASDAPPEDAQETPGGWPALLPRVSVADGHLELVGDGYGSRFDGIWLSPQTPAGGEATALQIEIAEWGWHLPPLRDGQVRAGARVGVDPAGRLVVEGLALNDTVAVATGSVDLSRLPRSVSFEARMPAEYGHLAVDGRHDGDRLRLHVDGEAVDLALVERILEMPPQDMAGQVAVIADMILPYDRPEGLHGEITVRTGAGRWRALAWDRILLDARAADGLLRAAQTEWQGAGNTLRLQDLSLPTAALFGGSLDQLLGGLTAGFDLALENIPALTALGNDNRHRAIGAVPPHRLVVGGHVREGVLRVDEGRLAAGSSTVLVNRLQIDLTELTGRATRANLEADATFDVPDLADLAALLPLPPLSGRLQGALVFSGSVQAPRGTLTLAGDDLYLSGTRLGDLKLACRSDGEWLQAETLALRNGDDRLDLSGRIHLASGRLAETRWTSRIQDIGTYANPFLPAEWPAQGSLELQSTVEGTLAQPDAQAVFTLSKAGLGGMRAEEIAGRLKASPHRLDIERVDVNTAPGDLVLAGRLVFGPDDDALTADLSDLSLQRHDATMRLAAPARVVWQPPDRWRLTPIVLEGAAGRITVSGHGGGKDPTDLRVEMDGLRSEPWLAGLGGPVRDFEGLDVRLALTGSTEAPRLEMSGKIGRLGLRDWPAALQGRFDIALDEGGIALRECSWTDGAAQRVSAVGRIPLVYSGGWRLLKDPLQFKADLHMGDLALLKGIAADFPLVSGNGQARLDLSGTLDAPDGTLRCAFQDLLLAPSFEGQPPGPFEGQAVLRLHGQGVDLDELRIDSALLSLQGRGHWRIEDDSAPWLVFTDRLPAGTVALTADLDVPDLGWLTAVLPGVQRITGRLNGALHVEGPWQAPAVTADLTLKEGSLRPEGDAPPLEALHADLMADANHVAVRSFRGSIGGAPFQVTGDLGRADGGGWVTDLHLTGTNLLLYRTQDIRVRADTDLRLKGPVEKMVLQGEIGLTNSRMSRNVDFFSFLKEAPPSAGAPREVLFSLPDPPLKDMVFDVAITSRAPIELRNNVIKGGLRPELHLGGTGELPLLTGEVYVDPARMRLPAGVMTIQSGVIRFLPARANRPEMDLLGEGKMFDYDITALVEGPVDEPRITLSSSPPLPGNELMLMLLTGQPPAAERRATESGIPMNLAVYIGQDLVTQWFEGDATDSWASVLDRFEVTHGRRMTRSGEETLEAQFRIGEDVFKDGDSVYITGEKDIFDFYNAGLKFVFRFK